MTEFVFYGKTREDFIRGGVFPSCIRCDMPAVDHPNPACDLTEAMVLRGIIFNAAIIAHALNGRIFNDKDAETRILWREINYKLTRVLIGAQEPTGIKEVETSVLTSDP